MTLVGMATQDYKHGSDWPTWAPKLNIRRSYNGPDDFPATHGVPSSFAASSAAVDLGLGVVTLYSFKPDVVLMAPDSNGYSVLDATINGFLDSIPEGHKAILTIWAEGDGKARGGMFTVAAWKAAVKHFCDLVAAHSNPDIKSAIILEAYQPTAPGTLYSDMYPGSCFDYFFVDGYTDLGPEGEDVFGKAVEAAEEWNVPWGIAEMGMRAGAIDAAWIARMFRYAVDNDAVAVCLFNSNSGGVPQTPGTDVAGRAAVMAISTLLYTDPDDFTN